MLEVVQEGNKKRTITSCLARLQNCVHMDIATMISMYGIRDNNVSNIKLENEQRDTDCHVEKMVQ